MEKESTFPEEQNLRSFLDYSRWLRIGPIGRRLSVNETECLLYLGTYPYIIQNQKTLGNAMGLKPASISQILDGLVEKKCITRKVDLEDGRSNRLYLTDYGKKVYEGSKAFLYHNSRSSPIEEDELAKMLSSSSLHDPTQTRTADRSV